MKSGVFGIIPDELENYTETKVYELFNGKDVAEAKFIVIHTDVSLSEYNKDLFNLLNFCIKDFCGDAETEYDEEDLILQIATHKYSGSIFSQKNLHISEKKRTFAPVLRKTKTK